MGKRMKVDLTGYTFGRYKVLKEAPYDPKRGRCWICLCSCGKSPPKIVSQYSLMNGIVKSCGCYKNELLAKRSEVDLIGKKFGRLTVIEKLPNRDKFGNVLWKCICDCDGKIVIANTGALTTGHTKSCGCYSVDAARERFTKWTSEEKELLDNHYVNMISRCRHPSFPDYRHYGGRGITVCEEWSNQNTGRRAFVDWAMSNGYKPGLTIDRIDTNGNYCPENCRWITTKEQNNNQRRNIFITVKGHRKTLKQWSEFLDYAYWRLKWMYHKFGEDAVKRYISPYVADDLSKLATGQLTKESGESTPDTEMTPSEPTGDEGNQPREGNDESMPEIPGF